MGKFLYGKRPEPVEVPDRTLAHVQAVLAVKLRRRESFMLNLVLSTDAQGYRSYWMDPSIPVQFLLQSQEPIRFNRAWVERLLESANQTDGMWLLEEPAPGENRQGPLLG